MDFHHLVNAHAERTQISLGNLLPSERPSFEMSEWASRIAQNCVGSVPVAVSPGPGAGSEPPHQTTTSIPTTTTKNHQRPTKQNASRLPKTLSPQVKTPTDLSHLYKIRHISSNKTASASSILQPDPQNDQPHTNYYESQPAHQNDQHCEPHTSHKTPYAQP